jgi:NTP pyrophosphatase (non-canonical NTP hydrolase)
MDITKISKRIYEIALGTASEYGCELTPELMFMHISEEVGEIARQLVNKNLPMREYSEDNLKEEIAQAILDLLALSEIIGMDLQKEINQKLTSLAEKRQSAVST